MSWLVLGLVLFFGVHSVEIVRPGTRAAIIARTGNAALWRGVYAVVSLVGLLLIIHGYGQARLAPEPLYAPPAAGRHIAMLLMVPVFPLLLAAYLPGRIGQALHHPMLVATVLWACAHLLANGNLADVLLFGAFGVWAVLDIVSLSRRPKRTILGAPAWAGNDIVAIVAGLALYAAFMAGVHQWITGMPLMPRG